MAAPLRWRLGAWWLTPAVVGGTFGGGLAQVYLELYRTASGWWGAGNTSIGLLLRGPLEVLHLYSVTPWLPITPVAVALFGLQAALLYPARRDRRLRTVAAAVYGAWLLASVAAAGWHITRLGLANFVRIEANGWRGFTDHSPGWFAAFGALLVARHAFACWCLLRRHDSTARFYVNDWPPSVDPPPFMTECRRGGTPRPLRPNVSTLNLSEPRPQNAPPSLISVTDRR